MKKDELFVAMFRTTEPLAVEVEGIGIFDIRSDSWECDGEEMPGEWCPRDGWIEWTNRGIRELLNMKYIVRAWQDVPTEKEKP